MSDGWPRRQVPSLKGVVGSLVLPILGAVARGTRARLLVPPPAATAARTATATAAAKRLLNVCARATCSLSQPDGAIVLFSGMGPNAQSQLSVGEC